MMRPRAFRELEARCRAQLCCAHVHAPSPPKFSNTAEKWQCQTMARHMKVRVMDATGIMGIESILARGLA